MTDGPIVETTYGSLRGDVERGVIVFRGIRYGATTGGTNRFKAPLPPARWSGVRDATTFGPAAPQGAPVVDAVVAAGASSPPQPVPQDEDCLVLNLWTSGVGDGRKRPVMVWLHGGGFRSGVGSSAVSNGVNLVKRGDVVLVSLNHRLNVFGHLFLEEIAGAEFAGGGVAGTLDIILALQWVRDNIERFGGDPSNVTLFGVSGGGRKISVLLGMPAAQGLFHKGIIQSGAHPRGVPRAQATRFARGFLDFMGVGPKEVAKLQAMPHADVSRKLLEFVNPRRAVTEAGNPFDRMTLSPVVDGVNLPADSLDPVAPPSAANVPIIIGTCRHEMGTFLARVPTMAGVQMPAVIDAVRPVIGARAQEVVDLYARNRPGASPYDLLVALASEDRRLLSIRLAETKMASGAAPVYMYQFAWETDYANGLIRAGHGLDTPFSFDNVDARPTTGTRADRFEMGAIMSRAWVAFARSGDPNYEGLPQWPPYDITRRATMILDVPPSVLDDPFADERAAWDGIKVNLPFEGPAFVGSWGAE